MTLENLIDDVYNRIKFDKDSLEKNELGRIQVDSFTLPDFWSQFGVAVQALNNEVTKVGFMCGKKPFPTDAEVSSMMQDLLQYYTVMRDLYLVLPEEVGASLFKAVTSGVTDIMVSLLNFVNSLHCLSEKGAKERLTLTGSFWDACNAVDSLPKDNLQATLKVLESEVGLASDAQMELETVSTCAAIDEVNNKFQGFQKVSIIAKESNSAHKSENILSPSTESNVEFHKESNKSFNEVNTTLQKSKASKFILENSGHDNCLKEHKVDHVFSSDLIENSDGYHKELKKVCMFPRETVLNQNIDEIHNELNAPDSDKNQRRGDSYFSHHTSESLLSEFIVLDEVHEDDEYSDNFDSSSVISSSLNGDNVVLQNEEEHDFDMGTGIISKTEEIKIDSETATNKTNFVTLPTSACQLPSDDVEASVDPGYKKEVYLRYQVPGKRLSGSVRKRRKKYLEEVSENLMKAFKLNISMENMEAMVINVPKSFIDKCDSFNINTLKDIICEHNPTLDIQKWVIYAHWLGDSKHLIVLLLVDEKSLQQLNALGCKINLSEDTKTGIKKFILFERKKQMSSGDSGNYRPTSSLKRDSKTISTKNKHSIYPSTSIKKNVISLANQTPTFTRDIPSMFLKSNKPSFHKKTFTRAKRIFIPDSNRPLYDPLERNKISMPRPEIRQINEISSTKSNKNYIGKNSQIAGGMRCDRVHPKAKQSYYGPNGPLHDDYCSQRSDFSRQDYSFGPFPKIKLNKTVSDNLSHRKRTTFSWCQVGDDNRMEQSESEHLRNRSSLLGHLKSSKQSGLGREEGCTSRDPSLRGFLSRGDSFINYHQGSTKRPRHQDIEGFYPPTDPSLRGFLSRGDSFINYHQGSTKRPRHQDIEGFYPPTNDFNY